MPVGADPAFVGAEQDGLGFELGQEQDGSGQAEWAGESIAGLLLARIAEDEATATAAAESVNERSGTAYLEPFGLAWEALDYGMVRGEGEYNDLWDCEGSGRLCASVEVAAHIARSDPARVLAECAAKRTIVDVVTGWAHSYNDEDTWYSCPLAVEPGGSEAGSGYSGDDEAVCRCGLEARQLKLLLPLAAIYSDHPDYRQEWAA